MTRKMLTEQGDKKPLLIGVSGFCTSDYGWQHSRPASISRSSCMAQRTLDQFA